MAVERTNFVLIEKSPAPNPIYKPANMAGAGRSLARSPRLASSYRTFRESRYTTAPGFESAMYHISWIRGFKVGVLGDDEVERERERGSEKKK